jgi:hypothetical protein
LDGAGSGLDALATLTPRYASQAEVNSPFFASDSFVMDGLAATGHRVFQSPLLFQGGNLLVIHDTARAERLLLLSETEVFRNVALGLTWDQVLRAFATEFGVERCVVLPAVSYHLDYDVTVRTHEGRMVAFVNDTVAAARLVVSRGIEALQTGGLLSAEAAQQAKANLARDQRAPVLRLVANAILPFSNERQRYRTALVRLFAAEATDSPVFNFQCFLAALDLLASGSSTNLKVPNDSLSADYFAALRRLDAAARAQQDELRKLGWKIVLVPSLPDLYHSLNYLNGIHDRTRFFIPAMGGFYTAMDDAAAETFQRALGEKVRLVRIYNSECQQKHGGVHCVASAYPRLEQPPTPAR